VDDAGDTIWALVGIGNSSIVALVEIPRGSNGAVNWLHVPVMLAGRGHLARCN
jgi:hypothetical protein